MHSALKLDANIFKTFNTKKSQANLKGVGASASP